MQKKQKFERIIFIPFGICDHQMFLFEKKKTLPIPVQMISQNPQNDFHLYLRCGNKI
jgi:hypothetical protein